MEKILALQKMEGILVNQEDTPPQSTVSFTCNGNSCISVGCGGPK